MFVFALIGGIGGSIIDNRYHLVARSIDFIKSLDQSLRDSDSK